MSSDEAGASWAEEPSLLPDDSLLLSLQGWEPSPVGLNDLLPLPPACAPACDLSLKTELDDNQAAARFGGLMGPSFSAFRPQQDQHQQHEFVVDGAPSDADGLVSEGPAADGKRRRRLRNAKQQELNRLAQQRYRQRKKQKYSDLQSTVDELSEKIKTIARLEGEAGELKAREAVAKGLLTAKDVALKAANAKVAVQQVVLIEQQRRLGEQQKVLDALRSGQQQQQQQQQQGQAAAPVPASPPASRAPSPVHQHGTSGAQQEAGSKALCERLLSALRAALAEVCEEQGLHAPSAAQEQVLLRFRRSLSSCCKEVMAAAVSATAGTAGGPEAGQAATVVAGVAATAAGGPQPSAVTAAVALAAASGTAAAAAAGALPEAAAHRAVTCY